MTDTVEHYLIIPRDPRAYETVSLCGQRIRFDSEPGRWHCEECTTALAHIDKARSYAAERCITLPAAARALNFDSLIVRECEDQTR